MKGCFSHLVDFLRVAVILKNVFLLKKMDTAFLLYPNSFNKKISLPLIQRPPSVPF